MCQGDILNCHFLYLCFASYSLSSCEQYPNNITYRADLQTAQCRHPIKLPSDEGHPIKVSNVSHLQRQEKKKPYIESH